MATSTQPDFRIILAVVDSRTLYPMSQSDYDNHVQYDQIINQGLDVKTLIKFANIIDEISDFKTAF